MNQVFNIVIIFTTVSSHNVLPNPKVFNTDLFSDSFNINFHIPEVGDVCTPEEPCIEGTICDPDGLCSCPHPYQIFDYNRKKCLSKVSGNCSSSQDCTSHAACILKWNSSVGIFDGTCHCVGRYFELPFDGTCGKLASYNEPCSSTINDINYQPCDTSKNLQCSEGTCQCSHPNYVYDDQLKICAIRASDSCYSQRTNPHQMCVFGAKCRHHGHGGGGDSLNSKPKLRCRCEGGYVENGTGFCQPSYGQSCSHLRPCYASPNSTASEMELICSGGKCQCSSPLYQQFDPKTHKCVNKASSPCFQGQSTCVHHAICSVLEGNLGSCICEEGFSATSEGDCKLTFRMNCTTTNGDNSGDECNQDAGLTCDDGRCNCFDNYLAFDKVKEMCVNRLGGFCGMFKEPKTGKRFFVGCSGSADTKCIKHFVGSSSASAAGCSCFCSKDVKTLYPPKQYCES